MTGKQVPEIILLNSHDGSSSYQMLPGLFRFVCQNGLICGQTLGEVRVSHKGDVIEKVIEGAYEVLGLFDRMDEQRDAMQSLLLPVQAQQALASAALTYRFCESGQRNGIFISVKMESIKPCAARRVSLNTRLMTRTVVIASSE